MRAATTCQDGVRALFRTEAVADVRRLNLPPLRCAVVESQGRRLKLGEVPGRPGTAVRYPDVLYHAHRRVPVDVVVYHDPTFAAPWYLLVPCWTRSAWTPADVVRTYRRRMQIEQSFRDFKTHLGVRGLQLKVRVAERLGRLLLAFCLAYALLVLLGATPGRAPGPTRPRGAPAHPAARHSPHAQRPHRRDDHAQSPPPRAACAPGRRAAPPPLGAHALGLPAPAVQFPPRPPASFPKVRVGE